MYRSADDSPVCSRNCLTQREVADSCAKIQGIEVIPPYHAFILRLPGPVGQTECGLGDGTDVAKACQRFGVATWQRPREYPHGIISFIRQEKRAQLQTPHFLFSFNRNPQHTGKQLGIAAAVHLLLTVGLLSLLVGCSETTERDQISAVKHLLDQAQYPEAALQAKAVLLQNPDSPQARYLLGASLFSLGDFTASEIELRKSLERKQSASDVVPMLAKVLLAKRALKQLTDEFGGTELDSSGASNSLKSTLALAFARLNNTQKANELLDLVLSKTPSYAPALLVRARLLAGVKDFNGAIRLIDNILSSDPGNADALLLKADITLVSVDDSHPAAELYNKVLQLRKKDLDAHFALVAIYINQHDLPAARKQLTQLSKIAPTNLQTKFFEAQLAFMQADYAKAKSIVQELLRYSSNNTKALQFAGATELQLGSLQQAESYFTKALNIDPALPSARRLLAQANLRLGQPVKALATLRPILEQSAPDPESVALAGEAYLQQGDQKKAHEYYQRAAKLKPGNVKIMTSVALMQLLQGNAEPGLQQLELIAAGDKGVNADLALITARMQRREWVLALKDIERLEKKIPEKPLAPDLRGRAQMSLNDFSAARKSFEIAISRDSVYYPAIGALTQLDYQDGKPEVALNRLTELLKTNPTHPLALLSLADIKARTGASKDEITALLREAIKGNPTDATVRTALTSNLKRKNDFKGAVLAAQEAVAALPNSPEMLDQLGLMQLASGDANQALNTFRKFAAMRSNDVLPYMRMADANIVIKDLDSAKASLKRAIEIKPGYLDAQFGLISLAMRSSKHEDALRVAKAVQREKPDKAIGFVFEGDIYAQQKKFTDAISAYSAGLAQRDPGRLPVKLHSTLLTAKRDQEALKFAAVWQKSHPADSEFLIYLGGISLTAGAYAEAERYYSAALQLKPQNFMLMNNVAWLMSKQNKVGAARLAAEAVALSPNNSVLLDTYALALAAEGNFPKAIEVAKSSIQFAPGVPLFQMTLAKTYILAGQVALARIELEKLTALGNRYDGQKEVSALLNKLPH